MAKVHLKVRSGLLVKGVTAYPSDAEEGDLVFRSDLFKYSIYRNGNWADLLDDRLLQVMSSTNSALTGTAADLVSTPTPFIRLTNASLVSVESILAGGDGQVLTLTNATGVTILLLDETGATTANRIKTGNGKPLKMKNDSSVTLIYDATSARWRVVSGIGSTSSGSGTGDDLDSLTYRASFNDEFAEATSDAASAVNGSAGFTNAVYSSANELFTMSYDAAHTMSTSGTAATLSGTPGYTVAAGDVVINLATGEVKKITTATTQTAYVLESAFASNLSSAAVCVSQAVHTKDIYNTAVDGSALSAAFSGATFSDVMVDYEDTTTAGDIIFDVNTAPVVGYTASPDGTSFTTLQLRPTLETTLVTSVTLPSAGTGLTLRFFAYKTSGTGTVNILRYKAFMQKTLTSVAGGVINSAYGFLNGTGSEYQSSLSVVGGKSTITLVGWTYAVGVSAGAPYGSIDVYVNGQLLPRFIDSTTTPDGSYLETSPSVITLDKNYSAQALSYEVLQRTQIVDNSTVNTSNITAIQKIFGQNVNDFVDMSNLITATTTTGTPAAGTFYSTIPNRASMPDLSQDLKVRFGVDRVMTENCQLLQSEIGVNGESVWTAPNDLFGRIRFVGSWYTVSTGFAGFAPFTSIINDYVEVTFYGTGLNLIDQIDGSARSYAVSTDGGAETVLTVTSPSGVLNNQDYGMNIIRPMVTGLTLGVHTVKIRNNTAVALTVFGFEMLNATLSTTTMTINPGTAYIQGSQVTLSSQQSVAYNSGFESGTLGSRGGRVLTYLKSNGTIGKAITPTGSQLNTSSADHTNEEIARVINWREFGSGRTDDFSTVFNSSNRAFTMDDDSTTLHCPTAGASTFTIADGFNQATASGNFFEFTFIGTGLDILNVRGATIDTNYTVNIDGTAIITNVAGSTLFGAGFYNVAKIVSGLPYGSHTVRVTCSTTGTIGPGINRFIIYQPKTPSLPSGAIELGRYNLFATYVVNTTSGQQTMGTGVLRKNVLRETQYQGTWTYGGYNATNIAGRTVTTSTNGDSIRFTFFGTGFDFRFASTGTAMQFTVAVDGSSNFTATNGSFWSGALTSSIYGTGASTFTASTGVVVTTTTGISGNGLSLTGLNLGVHTVVVTKSSAAATTFVPEAFDIITPIHAYKNYQYQDIVSNVISVGSQSIEDGRKFSLLAEPLSFKKAWGQALGVTSAPTTNLTSYSPMPDMTVVLKTNGGGLDISWSCSLVNNTLNASPAVIVYVDGVPTGPAQAYNQLVANETEDISGGVMTAAPPGVHVVQLFWLNSAGTTTAAGILRTLKVREM